MTARTLPELIILDIDGTLLDTPHFEAWRDAGREVAAAIDSSAPFVELTFDAYAKSVAGRPRMVGAEQVLREMGVDPDPGQVERLAAVKQQLFRNMAGRATIFPDAARFLERHAARPIAVVTASENAGGILAGKADSLSPEIPIADIVKRLQYTKQRVGNRDRGRLLTEIAGDHGYSPDQAVVIDDSIDAVAVARSVGIRAVWLDRTRSAAHVRDDDRVINSLDDPISLLRSTDPTKGSHVAR